MALPLKWTFLSSSCSFARIDGSERMWNMVKARVCAVVTVPAPMIVRASSVSRVVDFSVSGRSPLNNVWKNVRCDSSLSSSAEQRILSI
jgi:hypothetical protein